MITPDFFDKMTSKAFLILLDLLMLVVPGVSIVYLYDRAAIFDLDILKLSLLGLVFTLPLIIILFIPTSNLLLKYSDWTSKKQNNPDDDHLLLALTIDFFLTNLIVYSLIFVSKYIQLNYQVFAASALVLGILSGILMLVVAKLLSRNKRKSNK